MITMLKAFINTLTEPHIICDANYHIVHANNPYLQQFGLLAEHIIGQRCYQTSHHYIKPCDHAGEVCPLADSIKTKQRHQLIHLHHTPNGQEHVAIELTPLFDEQGQLQYFIERISALPKAFKPSTQPIGKNPRFLAMLNQILRLAPLDDIVLLLGESGTGKEVMAHMLHAASQRVHHPFVTVDCTGLSENLIESELFGHEKGAFTGAIYQHNGLIESADGGTLFLDEIGDMPLSMQAKILRFLETGTYRRVGATQWKQADVRIIAATHHTLPDLVTKKLFRADLYYRLSVFPLYQIPLRERLDDLPLLVEYFLSQKPDAPTFTDEAIQRLAQHDFPGNIRELRTIIRRCCVLSPHTHITAKDIETALGLVKSPANPAPFGINKTSNRQAQAQQLGISERTLYRWIKQGKIRQMDFI